MLDNTLKFINNILTTNGIKYSFVVNNDNPITYPYFVGSYSESEPFNEDLEQDSTFILTGFTRSTWSSLESAKNTIKNLFIEGLTNVFSDGSACFIGYQGAMQIPEDDPELKKIQINLIIKEWMVM